MPGLFHFLRCLGRAVIKNGARALANIVPGGEFIFDAWMVGKEAYEDYRKEGSEAEMKSDLEKVAQATPAEVRQAAEAVAADQPAEVRAALTAYLTQLPGSIRHALRRPSDPTGTTIPAGLSLQQPEELQRFLPTGLPRFKPGDQPLPADWELVEMLGKGGFGEVWKARHLTRSSQKPVALKFCLDPIAAQTLRNEVSLHDMLDRVKQHGNHLGIVPLLETYLRAETPCLMYEFIEGGNLTGLIQGGKLTPTFATRIVQRLATIMSHAHRLDPPLVHRDLKPANILVRRDEKGKNLSLFVADFGIGGLAARQMIQEEVKHHSIRSQTLPKAVRGAYTPLYASPQQVQGERPDPQDDVHALGVIWYQLVTSDLKLITIPPDWREVIEERGLSKEQIEVMASCITSQAKKRLPNASDLADRLAGLLNPRHKDSGIEEEGRQQEIKVTIPGRWLARPANEPKAEWKKVRVTPGQVTLRSGEVYCLRIDMNVTDKDLVGLAYFKGLTSLQHLDLSLCEQVTDAGLAHLKGLTSLQHLDLDGCEQVTDAGLAHLKGLTSLQHLHLGECKRVTDAGLAHLKGLTSLQHLDLGECKRVTDAGLAQLKGLTSLDHLNLMGCERVTDAGLAQLKSLTSLQYLDLLYCKQVTDAGLAQLKSFTSLQYLYLSDCEQVTDAGLAHLKGLTSLQQLCLSDCEQVTDAGLAHLKGLTSLQQLCLSECEQVTDAGLAHLKGLTSLQVLSLSSCEQVTDAGLAYLKGLTSLRALFLSSCKQVTDAGLVHLNGLTSLQQLDLGGCEQVTPKGRKEIRGAIPGLKISLEVMK